MSIGVKSPSSGTGREALFVQLSSGFSLLRENRYWTG
ncbi:MAG: hypothetical protein FD148_789 [Methylocystaceae bacterium]|nr:MAG: hypothetical protein FD148_789 [Methylocystaceae bacterium]